MCIPGCVCTHTANKPLTFSVLRMPASLPPVYSSKNHFSWGQHTALTPVPCGEVVARIYLIFFVAVESLHRIPPTTRGFLKALCMLQAGSLWISTRATTNGTYHCSVVQRTSSALHISRALALPRTPGIYSPFFRLYGFLFIFSHHLLLLSSETFSFFLFLLWLHRYFFLLLNNILLFGTILFVLLFRLN